MTKSKQWTISQTPARLAKVERAAALIGNDPRNFAAIVDFALSHIIHTAATEQRTARDTYRAATWALDHAAQFDVLAALATDIVTAHASLDGTDDPEELYNYYADAQGELPQWITEADEQIIIGLIKHSLTIRRK